MNNSVYEGAHAPCGYLGVLGCGGYKNTDQIICLTATGDNNFLSDGIVEGTLLFIDTNSAYQNGQLNVFRYKSERTPQYKLSRKKIPHAAFIGKVLMAINQYGLRPEFKEAMDAYEDFYGEYCDFMVKYKENPSDLSLLAEYAEIMERAIEMDEAFQEWEDEDLNDEELKYYLEVNNRVMQMLVDAM